MTAGAVEIACDESGAEGERLAGGQTRLFSHASVAVPADLAADCLAELRDRIRSPALQYKANHLLRRKHRSTLEWFLGPEGPVSGRARVVVLDKPEVLLRVFTALVSGPGSGATARRLAADVTRTLGEDGRRELLGCVNELLSGGSAAVAAAGPVQQPVQRLAALTARLRSARGGGATGTLAWLTAHREAIRSLAAAQSRTNPERVSVDPLGWAITRTVDCWGGRHRAVSVVHDRHVSLTPGRIQALMAGYPARDGYPAGLVGFRVVASTADPRVQVADFLAGIARNCLTAARTGALDRRLLELVTPYVTGGAGRDCARSYP